MIGRLQEGRLYRYFPYRSYSQKKQPDTEVSFIIKIVTRNEIAPTNDAPVFISGSVKEWDDLSIDQKQLVYPFEVEEISDIEELILRLDEN